MRLFLFALLISLPIHSKLLDRIAGVINDRVVTLSEVQQIRRTLKARREISPLVYDKSKFSNKEILDKVFFSYIIRDRLSQVGYVVSDDSVEGRIRMTEKRLGISRSELMKYLRSEKVGFEEYFEVIRETMELNIFNGQIIAPLVSITEQEVKNTFYKKNSNNKALDFKYTLVDFSLPMSAIDKGGLKDLPRIMKNYRLTGNIPEAYKEIESNVIPDISEDSLSPQIKSTLKPVGEGEFSKALVIGDVVHIFFVKVKNLQESDIFAKQKERIKNQIYFDMSKKISKSWFEKEKPNYFIKYLL
jgi:peptidyl-prolyl cis-trans isomerase SurA